MSGHSKWSTIKRDKGINDAKRGQIFTKYANAIAITARGGGANPDTNFKLRLAIEAARSINMPKDNIQRAIDRGSGAGGGQGTLEEVTYEGFAPGGVGVLVETVTDNRMRTSSNVRTILDKAGGSLAGPGAVGYGFKKQGQVTVDLEGKDHDEAELQLIDLGAEDVEEADPSLIVYTKLEELEIVKEKISAAGFKVTAADMTMTPTTTVSLTDKTVAQRVLGVIDKLEELDDVQKVYANFDIADNLLISNAEVTK